MLRGQFWTVFTLGFAAAVGLLGIAVGAMLLWSGEAAAWATIILGAHGVPQSWLEPAYMALSMAGAAVFAAYWIIQIQQTLVRWLGDRAIAKLTAEYRAIAQTQGSEYADEYIKKKFVAMYADDNFRYDLFGRKEMLRALAADGVRIPDA